MKFLKSPPIRTRLLESNLDWFDRLLVRLPKRTDGLNQNMFNEDFLNIFRHYGDRFKEIFDIQTNDSELSDRLLGSLDTRYGHRQHDQIVEFVEEVAQSILYYGKAFYFVDDRGDDGAIALVNVSGQRVFKIFGFVIQYSPPRSSPGSNDGEIKSPREVRLLDRRKMLQLTWPRAIRRKILAQNKILVALDKYDAAVAWGFQPHATHENPNPRSNFDFKKWRESHDFAFYKATKQTGWNGRMYDAEKRSDFFDCYRLIRFRRMQLTMRDGLLSQLSAELTRVGKEYSSGFYINIAASEELPTISQFNSLELRLSNEEASFKEVIDFCFRS